MKIHRLVSALALGAATLAAAGAAQAAIVADILWVIDTSGSMGDDINEVKQRVTEFDSVMLANGVDARYGLVRFGGTASLIQDLTSFAAFTAPGSAFSNLTDNGGGTEDGSEAMRLGVNSASWRTDSVRNIILITDEDDDSSSNRAALQADLDATVANELINIIGNPQNDSNSYYQTLAPANGGQFFNILDFRADPDAFFTNFVNTKLDEIVDDFCTRFPTDPQCTNRTPEPGSLPLVAVAAFGLAWSVRRRAQRAAGRCDGQAVCGG